MILVDSSVLIDFLRGRESPAVRRLEEIESEGEAAGWALPLVCLQEVLQGAKDEREWRTLRQTLESQEIVSPVDPLAVHVEAARIDQHFLQLQGKREGDVLLVHAVRRARAVVDAPMAGVDNY